jgi:multiple sugar transport system substrate-binding protein
MKRIAQMNRLNRMTGKGWIALAAAAVLALPLAGCSKASQEKGKEAAVDTTPVKLMVYSYSAGIVDSEFEKFFVKPVQQKYPNITFELVTRQADNNTPEKIIASGNLPDLILTSNVYVGMFNDLGLGLDLNALAKKYNVQLDKFEPTGMSAIKQFGDKGQLYAVPFSTNYGVMLYNKDIFDKFGLEYPKDGMTWEQTIELGKKLTRMDGAAQFIGVDPDYPENLYRQYSLPYVDDKMKPVINNDAYKKVYGLLQTMYSIPGFIGEKNKFMYTTNGFFKDRNLAMLPAWGDGVVGTLEDLHKAGNPLNWDMVTYPSFADRPGIGKATDLHLMMISGKSKNQETAFKVISTLATEEVQKAMNNTGRLTALNNDAIKKTYASELPSYKGKHMDAVFKSKPAPIAKPSDYDLEFKAILREAAKDMAQNKKDVNTVLREANDKAEKAILEVNSRKK